MPKAITTKFLPHTNTLPARIVAADSDGNKATVKPDGLDTGYSDERTHRAAVDALCQKMGWTGELVAGELQPGSFAFVFLPNGTTAKPKRVGILYAYTSARDSAGNCYHAFEYEDEATGKTVKGYIGSGDNVRLIGYHLNGGTWDEFGDRFVFVSEVLPIRKFDRMVKGWPDVSSNPPETAADYIRKSVGT